MKSYIHHSGIEVKQTADNSFKLTLNSDIINKHPNDTSLGKTVREAMVSTANHLSQQTINPNTHATDVMNILGTKVTTHGHTYAYLPYWFKINSDDSLTPISLEILPIELEYAISDLRDEEKWKPTENPKHREIR